jgi:hypothetical protein
MATRATTGKKVVVTPGKAAVAARRARKHYAAKKAEPSPAWRKGGKQWSRVMGHFGHTT